MSLPGFSERTGQAGAEKERINICLAETLFFLLQHREEKTPCKKCKRSKNNPKPILSRVVKERLERGSKNINGWTFYYSYQSSFKPI